MISKHVCKGQFSRLLLVGSFSVAYLVPLKALLYFEAPAYKGVWLSAQLFAAEAKH